MPARKRVNRVEKKASKFKHLKFIIYAFLAVLLIIFLKKVSTKKYLKNTDKVNIAIQEKNGDVSLVIFDLVNTELTRIIIPGNTEIESAHNFGNFRLKKIWQLSYNEGIGGKLLSQTLTKYFKFPNFIWADSDALNFISSNPIDCIKPIFIPFKTNLELGDKIVLSRFCMKVNNIDRTEIDLAKSSFIKKTKLIDGEEGYVLSGLPSPKLYSNLNYFAGSKEGIKIAIKDGTENPSAAIEIGEIAEIMGAKVASIIRTNKEDVSCMVKSKDSKMLDIFSSLFGCIKSKEVPDENFNLEMIIGSRFSKEF